MIYTIATQKGGTGKTTTAAALAQAAAYTGGRALAIDLDPQGNLSYCFGFGPQAIPTSYDLLHGEPIKEIIQQTPQGVDMIPASRDLRTETSGRGTARRLQKALKPIRGAYNLIIIDTPATAGELQYNALQAADGVIITLELDGFNLLGLQLIEDDISAVRESNHNLKIAGLLLTKYEPRPIINRQLRETVKEYAAAHNIPYLGEVRKGIAAKEFTTLQRSLFEYAPKSNPAADYLQIYNTLNA